MLLQTKFFRECRKMPLQTHLFNKLRKLFRIQWKTFFLRYNCQDNSALTKQTVCEEWCSISVLNINTFLLNNLGSRSRS